MKQRYSIAADPSHVVINSGWFGSFRRVYSVRFRVLVN